MAPERDELTYHWVSLEKRNTAADGRATPQELERGRSDQERNVRSAFHDIADSLTNKKRVVIRHRSCTINLFE